MSLRALGSFLTRRRFSPRRIPRAQAHIQATSGSAAGRPARSLHTLVNLRSFHPVHAVDYGAVATIALAGLATILYFNEDTDKSGEMAAHRKAVKEPYPYLSKEATIDAGFVDKDDTVQWASYLDHVNFQRHRGDKEASAKEVSDWEEAVKQHDVKVDEATMKARFQDWMKEHNRSYTTEEEKASRYEIFKETAIRADKANAVKPMHVPFAPNGFAHWTDEECNSLYSRPGSFDWERYIDHMNTITANGGLHW